jgi:peptide/nickel transport system ATP-binding protein
VAELQADGQASAGAAVLIRAEGISKRYHVPGAGLRNTAVDAVRAVDLDLHRGEILALVGQSGSGKSTLGRIFVQLTRATGGHLWFEERDVNRLGGEKLRAFRHNVGIVLQNPYSSLNPRIRVGAALAEPLRVWRVVRREAVAERVEQLLTAVALPTSYVDRYPHMLSGGERQRVAIARALAVQPRFLVADEAVSSLDVSATAEILNLLLDLRDDLGLTVLFTTHDLSVARVLGDRIAVMQHGQIVEIGTGSDVLENPKHEYTRRLLDAQLKLLRA